MAIEETKSLLHWNYFLALESDVERLARFVEFTSRNFDAYSVEMAHLFLAAASEVDVVARQLCSKIDEDINPKELDMDKYRGALRRCYPEMEGASVAIPRYGLVLRPWSNWQEDKNPYWWRDHNKVKHERGEHFSRANLKNVLNAMAGLFLIVLYYHRDVARLARLEPSPNLFLPPADLAGIAPVCDGPIVLYFKKDIHPRAN
jgi:hypothetical protein